MLGYLLLAIVKVFDNIIITAKNIATYQEKKIISSVLVIVSQLLFYLVISEVISDNSVLAIVIVSISSGLGNYIAFTINNKFKHDTKWTFVITSSYIEDIKSLCNHLTAHNVKHIANSGFTRKGEQTIHVIVFSKTKNESRLIENYLQNNMKSKYLKEII